MNIDAHVDWIGTARQHAYEENGVHHHASSIDFTLTDDDNRYKLVIYITKDNTTSTRYEIKQYGTKPGRNKPFLMDTEYVFENKPIPLIETILRDPYVQTSLRTSR